MSTKSSFGEKVRVQRGFFSLKSNLPLSGSAVRVADLLQMQSDYLK